MSHDLYWNPPVELDEQEQRIFKRAGKRRKLFAFLRKYRHVIFDHFFQDELIELYRRTGAGKPPHPPAQMLMAVLLQAYANVSDHDAVEHTVDSLRWQMVLGRLGAQHPLFSSSTLYDFRMRIIAECFGQRILERTIEVARDTGDFSVRTLRAALDSAPLMGVGRVEDTVNLLAHAARKVIEAAAELCDLTVDIVIDQMGLTLFNNERSIKAMLDISWADAGERYQALQRLHSEIELLQDWLQSNMPFRSQIPPLKGALETLKRIQEQDFEPDPDKGGIRIREGVARDRQISISDPEMRHGRKSKNKRFDGYKRHVLHDIDEKLILAVDVGPANEADHMRLKGMVAMAENQDRELSSLHIDLGYFSAAVTLHKARPDVDVVCKAPGIGGHRGYFTKRDFIIDTQAQRVTCPNGIAVDFDVWGQRVVFPESECRECPLRKACTSRKRGGRTLGIHVDEVIHQDLLKSQRSSEGREALRERVKVEHALGRVSHNQGPKARYRGVEKNVFHMQIQGGLYNLQRAAALWEKAALDAA